MEQNGSLTGQLDSLSSMCGIGAITGFQYVNPETLERLRTSSSGYDLSDYKYWSSQNLRNKKLKNPGGCGWLLASFIKNHLASDEMYKFLCKTYPKVFESPVRRNKNSGNDFFFAIFDTNPPEEQPKDLK